MKLKVISVLLVLFFIAMGAFYIFLTIFFYVGLLLMAFFILSRSIAYYGKLNELAKTLTYSEIGLLVGKKALRALLSWDYSEYQLKSQKHPQLPVESGLHKEYRKYWKLYVFIINYGLAINPVCTGFQCF